MQIPNLLRLGKCPNCKIDLKPHIRRMSAGENNPRWKGNNAKYSAIHMWIGRHFGKPKKCEECGIIKKIGQDGKNRIQWANISGHYLRERNDWMTLCDSCHTKKRLKGEHINKKYANNQKYWAKYQNIRRKFIKYKS